MRSTLFFIPHELLGVPLLGIGWLLLALVIGFIAWALWLRRHGEPISEILAGAPVWLIAAGLVVFVLPQIEARWPDGQPIGLPVRGYGVMVLLGLFSGIGITVWRGRQVGVSPDMIVSLGFWMMVGGVLGARLFFVVQYWNEYAVLPLGQRIVAVLKLTEGGLVIYGGMIGGAIAGAIFCRRFRQPILAFADLIAPGFLIGLAFGRIGCLLNGCCFGGVCTAELPAIRFPQGSPPYVRQLENGQLLGLKVKGDHARDSSIVAVEPGSIAEKELGAQPGMRYSERHVTLPPMQDVDDPARTPAVDANITVDHRSVELTPSQLPGWSLPVHPSQIYSSIDALLLCLLILAFQPWVPHDGQAFLLAVLLHSVSRFTLELIRSDEGGQFGTSLTIAQWISIVAGGLAIIALIAMSRTRPQRAWAWPAV
ncbi:MAG: prolipoprotein diacylglyceryl transferase [Aureliella sp.]